MTIPSTTQELSTGSAPPGVPLHEMSALHAARAIRRGELTSEALVKACLSRIAEREPEVGAWAHVAAEQALAAARACDARQKEGAPLPPLHGIPVGIKDTIDTADMPTEHGSPLFAGRRPDKDAAVVAALRRAGAVILGKTVTAELAFLHPGKTRNPRDLSRTPGGSSSGSGAAVADGHVPLALGTQTRGSLLRPASFCGVVGFKPTFGRISCAGVLPQAPPLDTVGALGRTLADIALITDILFTAESALPAGDPGEMTLMNALRTPLAEPPRFAAVHTPEWDRHAEDSVRHAFDRFVAGQEGVAAGRELPHLFAAGIEAQRILQFADLARTYGPWVAAAPEKASDGLKMAIERGADTREDDYERTLSLREVLRQRLHEWMRGFDALIAPAAAEPAPVGLETTGNPAFQALWTYLGVPAISLPLLEAEGMPLGVLLVGRPDEDARLLAIARQFVASLGRGDLLGDLSGDFL